MNFRIVSSTCCAVRGKWCGVLWSIWTPRICSSVEEMRSSLSGCADAVDKLVRESFLGPKRPQDSLSNHGDSAAHCVRRKRGEIEDIIEPAATQHYRIVVMTARSGLEDRGAQAMLSDHRKNIGSGGVGVCGFTQTVPALPELLYHRIETDRLLVKPKKMPSDKSF